MPPSTSDSRPIYVLGAGFSKAISDAMPVTDELGDELQERLAGIVELDLREGQSFEDWLTLQITSLPFLERHANAQRAANAERVIAEIALILDARVATASQQDCPIWLRQLTAMWDAEKAVVLTFNYDTLLERAVNSHPLATGSDHKSFQRALGDHLVYPAPAAPPAQLNGDSGSPHNSDSFQVLKLHGSLAWHWASGDISGSTLVRVREKHVFGSSEPFAREHDYSGAKNLDRYLIPPVLSKDGYYGSYLANSLWRRARQLIANADSLTLIGYSLPAGDRVTSELIAGVHAGAEIRVVDRNPEEGHDNLIGRLGRLGLSASADVSGPRCVADYVERRIAAAAEALPTAISDVTAGLSISDVVVSVANTWRSVYPTDLFVLAWDSQKQIYTTKGVDRNKVGKPGMSYREVALNQLPHGTRKLEDFMTVERLTAITRDGRPLHFSHERIDSPLVAIGASILRHDHGTALLLKWAPAL
jgi:hypothetical protein